MNSSSARILAPKDASHEGNSASSPAPSRHLAVRILKGKTAHPVRRIDTSRFLIGAGSNCQLKLGGEMPMVHSVITWEGTRPHIECLVPHPPLRIGGEERRESELVIGTLLEIGPFQFEIALTSPAAAGQALEPPKMGDCAGGLSEFRGEVTEQLAAMAEDVPIADQLAIAPEDLSIHELIDRLGGALERLEQLERQRRQGLAALLETIARTTPRVAPAPAAETTDAAELPSQRRSA